MGMWADNIDILQRFSDEIRIDLDTWSKWEEKCLEEKSPWKETTKAT